MYVYRRDQLTRSKVDSQLLNKEKEGDRSDYLLDRFIEYIDNGS